MKTIIDKAQKRFYGNLHSHTTRSDGLSTPEEVICAFKEAGYNFLAITDHRRVFNSKEYDTDDFILIPGMEMDTWVEPNPKHQFFHFQVLGELPHDHYEDTKIFDNYIDSMKPFDTYPYVTILNHPRWSRMDVEYIKMLKPTIMEIYNHGCEVESATGLYDTTWDHLLHAGINVYGVATDDNHQKIGENQLYKDYFGGVTVVLTEQLSRKSILHNLSIGNFYSKMTIDGPDFHSIKVDGDTVSVETSPISQIRFIAFNHHGKVVHSKKNDLTKAIFKTHGHIFLRIELEDRQHRKAWSNPIYFT